MTKPLDRRAILAGLMASAALPLAPLAAAQPQPARATERFRHGVASGDPDAGSVILWTRVEAQPDAIVPVRWEVAEDAAFARIVAQGTGIADPERDHTVKILATGLAPGGRYHYRFHAGGEVSPIGRTRTLPRGRLDRLGIALVSCSNYAFGHFNAYAAVARDAAIDFVLHTGDYIYEYGADEWGAETARRIGRVHEPANEIVSLSDYRRRHAQYKRDTGSLAMHAAHPLLACWDDHESANNPWTGGAQNHQPDKEGSWTARREAAIRAYYEWMPIREPDAMHSRAQFWRSYAFGDLATLVTLETRHTARGQQVDYMDYAAKIQSAEDAERLRRDVLGAERPMLSPEMQADLSAALTASVESGQPWRLIGNAVPMARTLVPDVVALGLLPDPEKQADPSFAARALAWKGKWNLPFYTDTWDGYPAAREAFYTLAREAGATDLLVLTGDSHSFWANQLQDGSGRPMGVELGTAGVSSPGDFLESGFDPATARKLDRVFAEHNTEVRWTDNFHQGYVRVALGRETARADFVAVRTLLIADDRAAPIRSETIRRVAGSLRYA